MGRNSGCDDLAGRGQRIRIIKSAVQFCSSPAVSLSGRASVRAIRLADACRILGKSAKTARRNRRLTRHLKEQ
jgi:hypothetical protein